MKQIGTALFLSVLLFGCAKERDSGVALSLTTIETTVSKANTLASGDEIGVFAAIEGTEKYFLDNTKYIVGADGRSLSTTSAVYYPEAKQAVVFYACFPIHSGVFSVPADQSTSLKQADLCWATASSTPVAAPVALEFRHKMARLLITTNTLTEKITIPNAFSGGTLDIKTGVFTPTLRSSISTTGTELVLPAQTVTRLVLTVSGVEYVFDGAILLESAKTTSINLTLNPTQKTATLSGSSTTDWVAATATGDPNSQIINQFKLHWIAPHTDYAKADKVTLTIENQITKTTQDIDATPTLISNESSAATCAHTLPVSLASNSGFWYPYTVTRARIYQGATLFYDSFKLNLQGAMIYRPGAQTLGLDNKLFVRDNETNTTDVVQWEGVGDGGAILQLRISTMGTVNWTASVFGEGLSIDKTSGSNGVAGETVGVKWLANSDVNAGRSGRVVFRTLPDRDSIVITTNQLVCTRYVMINGIKWATGSLVAEGANGCRIGTPKDCGLYFQFGSLLGWSGGGAPNYDGTGLAVNSEAVLKVKPIDLNPAYDSEKIWPTGGSATTLNKPYFSVTSSPYSSPYTSFLGYAGAPTVGIDATKANLGTGRYQPLGVGDACAAYLGGKWRLPNSTDLSGLYGVSIPTNNWVPVSGCSVSYSSSSWNVTRNGVTWTGVPTGAREGLTTWYSIPGGGPSYQTMLSSSMCGDIGAFRLSWYMQVGMNGRICIESRTDYGHPRVGAMPIRCVQ